MSISNQLKLRLAHIGKWLEDAAPYTAVDQRHLVEHSPEQAYWNHGYMMACADIMSQLQNEAGNSQTDTDRPE